MNDKATSSRLARLGFYLPHAVAVVLCAMMAWFLLLHKHDRGDVYGEDPIAMLMAPYRMARGDIPGHDFMSPLGFLYYLPTAMITHWSHFSIPIDRAFWINYWLMNLIATCSALWFTRGEKAWFARTLYVLAVAATAGAMFEPETPSFLAYTHDKVLTLPLLGSFWNEFFKQYFSTYPGTVSLHGSYRLYAAGFFGLVFFRWAYLPQQMRSRAGEVIDGCLLGLLGAVVFYSKSTYFVAGIPLLIAGYFLFRQNRLLHLCAAATFIAFSVIAQICYGGVVIGYIRDIETMMGTHSRGIDAYHTLLFTISPIFFLMAVSIVLYCRVVWKEPFDSYAKGLALFFLLMPASYFVINQYDAGTPGRVTAIAPVMVLGVLAIERGWAGLRARAGRGKGYKALVAICILCFCIPVLQRAAVHLNSVISSWNFYNYAMTEEEVRVAPITPNMPRRIDASKFRPVLQACKEHKPFIEYGPCYDDFIKNGAARIDQKTLYVDGMDMLKRNHADHVFVMDFVDPYSIMLHLSLPKSFPSWFAAESLYENCAPAGEALLSTVDFVFIPHYPFSPANQGVMLTHYLDEIKREYTLVDEDDMFTLYKRKAPSLYVTRRYSCDMYLRPPQ